MKRRTFFGSILLAIAGLFVPSRKAQGYLPSPPEPGLFSNPQARAFGNHLLSRYEGRTIPNGVVFSQNVGLGQPVHQNAKVLKTQKLRSVTKDS